MLVVLSINAYSQGSIEGVVLDRDSSAVPFTSIAFYQNDTIVTGAISDFDGYYSIENLNEGIYDILVSNVGYTSIKFLEFKFIKNQKETLNFDLDENFLSICVGPTYPSFYYNWWKLRYFTFDNSDISELKLKNINEIVTTAPNVTLNKDNELSFKGSRPGDEQYIIDGMTVHGKANISTSSINSMDIYHNGIPAKYGNTTSAVIVINTNSYYDYFD